jgi:hypothetical protein
MGLDTSYDNIREVLSLLQRYKQKIIVHNGDNYTNKFYNMKQKHNVKNVREYSSFNYDVMSLLWYNALSNGRLRGMKNNGFLHTFLGKTDKILVRKAQISVESYLVYQWVSQKSIYVMCIS